MLNSVENKISKMDALNFMDCYDAIFFDLDGTLVDTNKMNFFVYKEIFNKYSLKITMRKWNEYFNGTTLKESLPGYLKSIKKDNLFIDIYNYFENFGDEIKMRQLKKHDIKFLDLGHVLFKNATRIKKKILLCTSSRRIFVDYILQKLEIRNYFDFIICGEDVDRGKPAPDIFVKAKAMIGLENVLVIEDSVSGLLSAKKAKCHCLLINNRKIYFYK